MSVEKRASYDDRMAERFDRRYADYAYDGVRETLLNFLGPHPGSVLEVGCGTGHWLSVVAQPRPNGEGAKAVGVDLSAPMLARARGAAPAAHLVRARAEDLPWRDATFDRVCCVNAVHQFADRSRFFAEARRVLKRGGGLLTIGRDPHTDRDEWWVYEHFDQTRAIDSERYARVRTLRGEMAVAGFAWTESMEADHIEIVRPAGEALAAGLMEAVLGSQLALLSAEQFRRGSERLMHANAAMGGQLQLVTDVHLYATIGWLA